MTDDDTLAQLDFTPDAMACIDPGKIGKAVTLALLQLYSATRSDLQFRLLSQHGVTLTSGSRYGDNMQPLVYDPALDVTCVICWRRPDGSPGPAITSVPTASLV